jgi:hypothetical protein
MIMVDFQDLHQKYVLGEPLSEEEVQQLEHWYAIQDAQEVLEIDSTISVSTSDMHLKINALFEQITQELIQIREITQENKEIKTANEILRSQLIQSAA